MRRALIRVFERYLYPWLYRRKNRRTAVRSAATGASAQRFEAAVQGLDTPWRVAAFLESALVEEGEYRLFDVPASPEIALSKGTGNAADYARLAQSIFERNGRTALLLTVYDARSGAPRIVCATQDQVDGGWHHISNEGLFGGYASLEAIADDLSPDWSVAVARRESGEIAMWL